MTANVVGNSIILGLAGALSTLCSQAYGANDLILLNETLQRAVLILFTTCIPLSISWIYSYHIIVMLGQSAEIAKMASHYLLWLIPGLFSFSLTVCVQGWLHSQQQVAAPAVISVITAILHPLWCYLFMYQFSFSYIRSAMAISTSRFFEATMLVMYIVAFGHVKKTQFQLSRGACSNWLSYLRLGIPNILMTSQWWAEEVIIFLSGTYGHPDIELAAMSVYQYMIGICFVLPKSFGVVASSRVGFYLGSRDGNAARIACTSAVFIIISVILVESLSIFMFRNQVTYMFTNDQSVATLVSSLMIVLSLYVYMEMAFKAFLEALSMEWVDNL